MKRLLIGLCLLVPASFCSLSFAAETHPQVKKEAGLDHLRDTRYCELLMLKRKHFKFDITVYSTVSLDNCPADQWENIKKNEDAVKKQFDAKMIKFNGPRYWTLDALTASKDTINTPLVIIENMKFKKRATLEMRILQGLETGDKPYHPAVVYRNTVWIYNAGTRVYELVDPEGNIYVMQSYSQIVDPTLQMSDLIDLEKHIKLPKDWKYQTR